MKSKFTGAMNVFRFAYVQSVKTKAFVVSLLVLCTIALLSLPVASFISGGETKDDNESKSELIGTIYIEDNALSGKIGESLKVRLIDMKEYAEKEIVLITEKEHDDIFDKV